MFRSIKIVSELYERAALHYTITIRRKAKYICSFVAGNQHYVVCWSEKLRSDAIENIINRDSYSPIQANVKIQADYFLYSLNICHLKK